MKFSRFLLFGLSALLLCSCGTTVQESLKVQPEVKSQLGHDKTVVILPFADYSSADNLETAYRRNLFVAENLTDQFNKYGFHSPVQEDVFLYLFDHNFINIVSYGGKKSSNLEYELNQDWSNAMKSHLQRYADLSQKNSTLSSDSEGPGTHGLTQKEIVKIGRQFSADYVVRGRIIQYKDRNDPTWNPLKKGILPFVAGVTNKVAFGQAESDKYDELNTATAGGAVGATISAVTDGDLNHAIAWGAAGAVLGNMAYHSGRIPQAVVQLRVWVQDAYTGDVVWTNRIDVKVSPLSVLADYQYDTLFEKATEKAITTLIDDFAQAINKPSPSVTDYPVSADTDKDGVPDVADHCPNTPVGVPVNALGCPAKENLILEGVNFDFDSAELTQTSQQTLDKTASALVNAPHVKVEVAGFTDSVGDDKYNLNLSNERSQAVVHYLMSKGVAPSQMIAKGYGEEYPIADNSTDEGRQKNRRTELRPLTR